MRDVTDLLTEAAPGPTTDVDPDAVWTGGRTRRRRRHVLTAIIGFVGIVGAGIGTAQVLSTPRPAPVIEEPRPGDAYPLPDGSTWDGPTVVLEGWRTVEAFGIELSVPPGWDVLEADEASGPCPVMPERPAVVIESDGCTAMWSGPPLVSVRKVDRPMTDARTALRLGEFRVSTASFEGDGQFRGRRDEVQTDAGRIRVTTTVPTGADTDTSEVAARLWSGLRPSARASCGNGLCAPLAGSKTREEGAGVLDIEVAGLDVEFRVTNPSTRDWSGGPRWHLERWWPTDAPRRSGANWLHYDFSSGPVAGVGQTFPPGTSPPMEAWLPPRPGFYRVVKRLDQLTLYSEVVRIVIPDDGDGSTDAPEEPVDLASPRPVPDSPDVAERSGAAARFVSCDGPLHLGGWAPDFGGPSGAGGPEAALQEFAESGPFHLPLDGYRPVAKADGRVLFAL